MTDKEKIRAEIKRLKRNNLSYCKPSHIADVCYDNILAFIDSLQEEPVKIDKQVSKIADEFAEREYETDGYERQWLSKGYYHGYMDANKGKLKECENYD